MAHPPIREPDDLSRVLRTWKVDAQDDPQLAHKVWQRIGDQRPSAVRAWFESLARLLSQPLAASAAVLVFAAAGAGLAQATQASAREARVNELAAEYARSIDPILMHGAASPSAPSEHVHTP